jgi:serine/threonine protein phosphatase PrpC
VLRFAYDGQSHVGLVRDGNEDAGFAGPYLQLVADGVGGAAAGEVASATTAYVVTALTAQDTSDDLLQLLRDATGTAHEQLKLGVERDPSRAGMATTLTAVVTDGHRCALVHVGDSRAYLLRDGELRQLTSDHTFVQSLVNQGRLAPEQVSSHPHRSVVLKSLDAEQPPQPDLGFLDLEVGDRLLLCSDGLTDLVPDPVVAESLQASDREGAVSALVGAALEAGGRDNVTCLVADAEDGPRLHPGGKLLGAMGDPYLVVDAAAVRAGRG